MSNPLLTQDGLPRFSAIRPEHVEPAIDQLLADNRRQIDALLDRDETPTWENFVEQIELLEDRLERAWSPVSHLNSVMNSDELRSAYNACLPKLSDYGTEMGHNVRLYAAYKTVAAQRDGLNAAQRKVLDNALRDFHLSGVDLPEADKARFKAISQQLSALTSDYSDKVLDATNAWSKLVDNVDALAGLPPSAIELAAQTGTPCYVYSRATLERHWRVFDETLSGQPHLICYAVKANSSLAVLQVLAKLGSGFDVVSVGELERVMQAGGDPARSAIELPVADRLAVRDRRQRPPRFALEVVAFEVQRQLEERREALPPRDRAAAQTVLGAAPRTLCPPMPAPR